MKHKQVLKKLIRECLNEILSEQDINQTKSVDEDPKVSKLRKKVEIDKQSVEREKQKSLDLRIKTAQKNRADAEDPNAKKDADDKIKDLNDKKGASKAALAAATKAASSIK